jgi:alkyl sulfatase BDS1-like metallo-beta-lactamase superfamily hydrolase
MADLLDLSSRVIDSGVADTPVNRVTQELSELRDDLAIVESFSHSVVLDTGDGMVAFDTSAGNTGREVVEQISHWRSQPVTHLMYTHGHVDHVGGSREFAARWNSPVVVGHTNVAHRFDRYEQTNDWNRDINLRQFGGIRADLNLGLITNDDPAGDLAPAASERPWKRFLPQGTLRPTLEVENHHSLKVGDAVIEAHHARGETDDHLWFWLPDTRTIMAGDFLIWNFPNAGNPQKVQRYPGEWAAALRAMGAMQPNLIVPAHGLPITGTERIQRVLNDIASALEYLVSTVVDLMNGGATLDEIIHSVSLPSDTLALPYLRPLYDEPEFVVRNIWRMYGGWWDKAPSRLKPAPDAQLAEVISRMAGGPEALLEEAERAAVANDLRIACHLADIAGWAAPDNPDIHARRAAVYLQRRKSEPSLMAKGIFAAAAKESQTIVDTNSGADTHKD